MTGKPRAPRPPTKARSRASGGQGDAQAYRALAEQYAMLFAQVESLYHCMAHFAVADLSRAGLDGGPARVAAVSAGKVPRMPAERFMVAWQQGATPFPLQACTAQQLYRAFVWYWHVQGGGAGPPTQRAFSIAARRWISDDDERKVRYTIANMPCADRSRRAVRCWLPIDPKIPAGMSQGQWVSDQVEAFGLSLAAGWPTKMGSR